MAPFSITHILMIIASIIFLILSTWVVSKLNRKWQNVFFVVAVIFCSGGIFYRYAMGMSFEKGLSVNILIQMLQVCNFNFVLLPLMLVPKFELARQYSFMFSMFAASTTIFSISGSWVNYNWYDQEVLNFWLYHLFAIACPIWMCAAKRLKPRKEYVIPVAICVVVYFTAVYGLSEIFRANGIIAPDKSFSFIYDPGGYGPLAYTI